MTPAGQNIRNSSRHPVLWLIASEWPAFLAVAIVLAVFLAAAYPHVTYNRISVAFIVLPVLTAALEILGGRGSAASRRFPIRWIGSPLAGRLALLCAAVLLNTSILFEVWEKGMGHPLFTVGGLVPYCDAAAYHAGAQCLVETGVLDAFNTARRPLPICFYAVLLKATGENLQLAILVATLMVSLSIYHASRAVCETVGLAGGVLMALLLSLFIAPFIGTFLTEPVGFLFGNLAFASLWLGVHRRSRLLFLQGLFLACLALDIRAGAFAVVPLLIVYAGVWFGGTRRIAVGFTVLCISVAASGLLVPVVTARVVGDPSERALFSNFAPTLYGLVAGGKGYAEIYKQHPELGYESETRQAEVIYEEARKEFVRHPGRLFQAVGREFVKSIGNPTGIVFPDYMVWPRSVQAALLLAAIASVAWLGLGVARGHTVLLGLLLAGVVLSAPFLADGGARAFAATMAVGGALVSMGFGLLVRRASSGGVLPPDRARGRILLDSAAPVAFLCVLLVGPLLVAALKPRLHSGAISSVAHNQTFVIRCSRGSAIEIVDNSEDATVPRVTLRSLSFGNPVRMGGNPSILSIRVGQFLWEGCDLVRRKSAHIVFDEDIGKYSGKIAVVNTAVIGGDIHHVLLHGRIVGFLGG